MIGETYELHELPHLHRYFFFSEGKNGTILKSVDYGYMGDNTYNLAFGDMGKDGKLNDKVISNNDDLIKVMNTVALTIYGFLEELPGSWVHIRPVDEKRSMLYHTVFKRRWDEIAINFQVIGMIEEDKWETYNPEKKYLAFKLAKISK